MMNANFKNDGRLLFFDMDTIPYRASTCVCCGEKHLDVCKVIVPNQVGGVWVHYHELSKLWKSEVAEVGSNSARCISHRLSFIVPMDEDLAEVVAYARVNGCAIEAYSPTHRKIVSPKFTSNQPSAKLFGGLACRSLKVLVDNTEVKSHDEYKKLTDRKWRG